MKFLLKILILLLLFFFIACGDEGNENKTENPCDNVECQDNAFCKEGKCICNEGYYQDGEDCKEVNKLCSGVECGKFSHCIVENKEPVCVCDENAHKEGENCESNQKEVQCDAGGVPENAEAIVKTVSIYYTEEKGWSEPEKCEWKCKKGFLKDNDKCIPDLCSDVECPDNSECNNDDGICYCNTGYHPSSDKRSCIDDDICSFLECGNNSHCDYEAGKCVCDEGYHEEGGSCVENNHDECGGCNGHGDCLIKENNDPVCACDNGYTPDDADGLHCVPTNTVCKGGEIDFDYNLDGVNESWFTPSQDECDMFELINFVRAVHDKEGSPESHKPLKYNLLFSAYARMHSQRMTMTPVSDDNPERYGEFEHGDFPPGWGGQNIAYSGDSHNHMGMYMGCSDPREPICVSQREGHCDVLSHHCNIMRPRFSSVGIGIYDVGYEYSTQNFR